MKAVQSEDECCVSLSSKPAPEVSISAFDFNFNLNGLKDFQSNMFSLRLTMFNNAT